MAQTMPEPPKRNNTWLIIVIVLVVVCCICLAVAGVAWQFGDQILRALGVTP
jgi:preprotein translocase subunit SecE